MALAAPGVHESSHLMCPIYGEKGSGFHITI